MFDDISFVRRFSQLGTRLMTRFCGELVGEDPYGNRYFRARRKKASGCESRWVLYKNEPEPTLVSPVWFGWLHHTHDQPLPSGPENGYVWQKPHQPNLSGTEAAPLPAAHPFAHANSAFRVQDRDRYQSWTPPE